MTAVLELDRASFRYRGARNLALTDVSLAVHRGRSLGIVGESGSGKSTALSLLLGLTAPESGAVRFEGEPLRHRDRSFLRRFRRLVQPVYQDPYSSLDPRQRVDGIIAEPLVSLRTNPPQGRAAAVIDALADVGLDADAARRYPHEFSGGQRQRIAIARALVTGPEVLLADEPVSALDVTTRIEIIRLLARLQAERGLTIVLVSHDMSIVAALCAETLVLKDGQVVESAPTLTLLSDPQQPYTRRLIAATPRLEARA